MTFNPSPEHRKRLEFFLNEVEEAVALGKEFDPMKYPSAISYLGYVFFSEPQNLSFTQSEEFLGYLHESALKGRLRRTLSKFYAINPPVPQAVALAALNGYKTLETKVFKKEGERFSIESYSWPNMQIVTDDKKGYTSVGAQEPEVRVIAQEPFTKDYKSLAHRIVSYQKESTCLLANFFPGTPKILQAASISTIVIKLMTDDISNKSSKEKKDE